MVKLFIYLKKRYEYFLIKQAVKKANKNFAATGNKFLVLWYHGRPLVKSKQELKKLVAEGYFQKGLTIQHIEAMSLYQTR